MKVLRLTGLNGSLRGVVALVKKYAYVNLVIASTFISLKLQGSDRQFSSFSIETVSVS